MSAANDALNGQPVSSSIGLRDILAGLFNRKWLITLTLFTSIVATGTFAWFTPEKYESRMKFLIKNVRVDTPVTTGKEGQVVADAGDVPESQITSEMELLKSRDLLVEVVKIAELAKAKEPGKGVTESDIETAVYKLERDLVLAPVKRTNIIEVSYSSTSPQTAALVLNKLAELYLDKHVKLNRPPGTSEFFKAQASQYEQDLKNAEGKFTNFQQEKDAVDIERQKELILTRLTEVNAKLKDLDGKIAQDDKRIAALTAQLAGMDRRVVTQSKVLPNQYSVERLNTMLVELRNRRIQLLAKFQPQDRVVKEVDDQINETTEALQKATGSTAVEQASDLNPLRQPLETELANVKVDQAGNVALRTNLQQQVQQYQTKLTGLAGSTAVHNELSRQVKQAEETYQLYARKQEESQIEDALDQKKITNITLAEAPIVPRNPNRNTQVLVLVLGLASGLMLSFGSGFVLELLRETFLTPRELQVFTGYPVLATIPLQKARKRKKAFAVSEPVGEFDLTPPEAMVTYHDAPRQRDAKYYDEPRPSKGHYYKTPSEPEVEYDDARPAPKVEYYAPQEQEVEYFETSQEPEIQYFEPSDEPEVTYFEPVREPEVQYYDPPPRRQNVRPRDTSRRQNVRHSDALRKQGVRWKVIS